MQCQLSMQAGMLTSINLHITYNKSKWQPIFTFTSPHSHHNLFCGRYRKEAVGTWMVMVFFTYYSCNQYQLPSMHLNNTLIELYAIIGSSCMNQIWHKVAVQWHASWLNINSLLLIMYGSMVVWNVVMLYNMHSFLYLSAMLPSSHPYIRFILEDLASHITAVSILF